MATKAQLAAIETAQRAFNTQLASTKAAATTASTASAKATAASNALSMSMPYTASGLNADNAAARRATESYASPFSTAFGGSAPSTTLDYVRQYASPFSTAFGGSAPATPYSPTQMTSPYAGTVSEGLGEGGGGGEGGGSGGGAAGNKPLNLQTALDDLISGTLSSYGIVDIAATMAKIRSDYPEATGDQILLLLKNDARYNANYNARFSGNAMRKKAGLPTLDDATYLKSEKEYEKVMKAYGLDKTSLNTQKMYGTFIGNMMDIADVTGRISLVFDNMKASPEIESSFRKYYPMLDTADIVATFLNPEEQLPALQRKVQAAEIGGAALKQGLASNLTDLVTPTGYGGTIGAEVIRAGGTTTAQARAGYEKIADELPTAQKLSDVYAGQGLAKYGQREGEKARFQGLASEKRKLEELIKAEEASYSAKAGTTRVSLKGTAGGF